MLYLLLETLSFQYVLLFVRLYCESGVSLNKYVCTTFFTCASNFYMIFCRPTLMSRQFLNQFESLLFFDDHVIYYTTAHHITLLYFY